MRSSLRIRTHSILLLMVVSLVPTKAESPIEPVRFDNLPIMDHRAVTYDALYAHISEKNPSADPIYVTSLHRYYEEECEVEGVSLLVELAQMVHETDYLLFSGSVSPIQYNYAGLGSTSHGNPGLRFPTMRIGVRAHVQHLKAYASLDPPSGEIVDPRFGYVTRGSASSVRDLVGRWASDLGYADKILAHAARLVSRDSVAGRAR